MKRIPGETFEVNGLVYMMQNYREAALCGCESDAETIIVPDRVEEEYRVVVKGVVFEGLEKLRHLIFAPNVWIGNLIHGYDVTVWPVRNCPVLETVTLPNFYCTKEGFPKAEGCPDFRGYLVHPGNENYIAEKGCLYRIRERGGLELVHCAGRGKIVRIPSRVNGRRVKAVDADAFADCTGVGMITLAEGITGVENAFCGAETVRLPNSYTSLREDTPWGFSSEGFVRFALKPDHPDLIEEDGFLYDRSGETLVFAPRDIEVCRVKEGVRFIGERAFGCHPKLKAIFLPESLEKIGRLVFEGCKKLYWVQLPAGSDCPGIGEGAFFCCDQLEMLYSPGGMIPVPRSFHDEHYHERWKAHYTPAVPDTPEEMAKKIGELGFEEYDRLYWKEPEMPSSLRLRLVREEIAKLTPEEQEELTACCIRLVNDLDL